MALLSLSPVSIPHPGARLTRNLRAAAAFVLVALAVLAASPSMAQSAGDQRCEGIVPQPLSTSPRLAAPKATTVRFVNDSDWNIRVYRSGTNNAPHYTVAQGAVLDLVSTTQTEWRWETINNPYLMARNRVLVTQPQSQCIVMTQRAPPQPPLNSDPRCADVTHAADPNTTLRMINDSDRSLSFTIWDKDVKVVRSTFTVQAGTTNDILVPLFSEVIGDLRGLTGALQRYRVDRRGAHCFVVAGGNAKIATVTPAPVAPGPVTPAPVSPKPVTPAPVAPTPVSPAPVAPVTPSRPTVPVVAPATPVLPGTPQAPTLPPQDTSHKACSQAELLELVAKGEASGTITLEGSCRYELFAPANEWSGGTGVYLWNASRIVGNGAIIERAPNATKEFRLLGFQTPGGVTIENLTLRGGRVKGDGAGLYGLTSVILRGVNFESNTAIAFDKTGRDRKTERVGGLGGALRGAGAEVVIESSRFIGNTGERGGAVFTNTATTVTNSVFANNNAVSLLGAAIYTGGEGSLKVTASTITHTVGNLGSAIESWAKSLSVRSTIIAWHGIGIVSYQAGAVENYNLFAGAGVPVSGANGHDFPTGAKSLVTYDPKFNNPNQLDFTIGRYSPAVDKGEPGLGPGTDIIGARRPFAGKKPDIGAFEAQEEAGPALSIQKTGPYLIAPRAEVKFTLTVVNQGSEPVEGVQVDDLLPAGATYVPDSISDRGRFADGRVSWSLGSLQPGERRKVSYRVIATSTLVSRDYGVTSLSAPGAGMRGRVTETPMKLNLVTDARFLPSPDGFSFPNYSDSPKSDITDKDLQMIFGAEACKPPEPGVAASGCILRADVLSWRDQKIESNKGGHCAGMALASLELFGNKKRTPASLMPGAETTYELSKDSARNLIGIYAATQTLTPQSKIALTSNGTVRDPASKRDARRGIDISKPLEVVRILIANLKDPNATDRYRLGFSMAVTRAKGHTVVPFAVEDNPDGNYYIFVYENNRPNNFALAFKVNKLTGAWSYTAQTNPAQPLEGYKGDGTDANFYLASWNWLTAFPMCRPDLPCPPPDPAAGKATDGTKIAGTDNVATLGTVSVELSAAGMPLVTRSDGKRAGFDPVAGEWISEIEGAEVIPVSHGFAADVPPVIRLPYTEGQTYSVAVSGSGAAAEEGVTPARLTVSAPGFVGSVGGLILAGEEAGDGDAPLGGGQPAVTLTMDPQNNRLDLWSDDGRPQEVTLELALSQDVGSDFRVKLDGVTLNGAEPGDGRIGFGIDPASQSLILQDRTGAAGTYGLEIERIHANGNIDIYHGELSDTGGQGVALGLGADWSGTGAPPVVDASEGPLPTGQTDEVAPVQDGSVVLQSLNYGERYLAVSGDGARVEVLPVTTASDPDLVSRSRFLLAPMPELGADVAYLMVMDGSGRYVVATAEGVSLQSGGGGGMAAFFQVVPGLGGQGISFASLDSPGQYLRHSGFVLRLDASDGSQLFNEDATFVPGAAFAQ